MGTFKDYYGKEVREGDRVLLPSNNRFVKGTVSKILGNCCHVACDDKWTRNIYSSDHFIILDETKESI